MQKNTKICDLLNRLNLYQKSTKNTLQNIVTLLKSKKSIKTFPDDSTVNKLMGDSWGYHN